MGFKLQKESAAVSLETSESLLHSLHQDRPLLLLTEWVSSPSDMSHNLFEPRPFPLVLLVLSNLLSA